MASRVPVRLRHALAALTGLIAVASGGFAHAQLRVAAWNISNWTGADRIADVQTAVYGVFNGRSMSPDIILAQEFATASSLTAFVNALNTASGSPGDWTAAPFVTGADTQSVCVFRTSKVTLVGNRTWTIAIGSSATTDQPRNTYRYDLRPVGYSAAATTIAMYSVHLKSGSASTDIARRLVETQRIRDNAEGVDTNGTGTGKPAAYQFLVGGDLNTQSSSQSAYAELVGSQTNNAGRLFDPIASPGSWNGNGTFRYIHTQDPSGTGGMDDRHDQILLSAGLIDGQGLDYIGNPALAFSTTTWNDPNHSYRCWGNDGSSFNTSLATTTNAQVGPVIAQALRNCATTAGGHLPVYLDMRVPAKISAPATIDFGTVVQGSSPSVTIQVGNGGDVAKWTVNGIATLSYSMSATGGFVAPAGTRTDAPGGTLNSHAITFTASTLGLRSGTLTIASNDADSPSLTIPVTATVVAANQPPAANAGPDQQVDDADGNGSESVRLDGSASSDPDGTIVSYVWREAGAVIASGVSPLATLAVGSHAITLTVTDNAGATASDGVVVTVSAPCIADFNLDGGVDGADLSDFYAAWEAGSTAADVNQDGGIDGADIESFIMLWEAGGC